MRARGWKKKWAAQQKKATCLREAVGGEEGGEL